MQTLGGTVGDRGIYGFGAADARSCVGGDIPCMQSTPSPFTLGSGGVGVCAGGAGGVGGDGVHNDGG